MKCDDCGAELPSNYLKSWLLPERIGSVVLMRTLQLCRDCRILRQANKKPLPRSQSRRLKMAKGSRAEIAHRRSYVLAYWIRGLKTHQIVESLKSHSITVERSTVQRDILHLQDELFKRAEAAQLYSLRKCFAELEQEWNDAWVICLRAPTKAEKDSTSFDDSWRKLGALARIHEVILTRARLCGYFSPQVIERVVMFDAAAGRGIQIERIPFEQQLAQRVDTLMADEGLARSKGIKPEDFTQAGPV